MIVEIENSETGERGQLEVRIGESVVMPKGWRVKMREIPLVDTWHGELPQIRVMPLPRSSRITELAAMISSWGLPLASSLSALRWIMGKNCSSCEVAGEFLRLLEDGVIDVKEAKSLVAAVLNAKDQKDEFMLQALKGRLEALRAST